MKKFLVEYISIIGYVVTGLVFSLAIFVLLINFYHYKDVNEAYIKAGSAVSPYTANKSKIDEIKSNSNVYDPNNFKSSPNNLAYMNIKSKLDQCVNSYESSSINKIFDKKTISVKDDYDLLTNYQNDIVNNCIVLNIYSIDLPGTSYDAIKPFVDSNSKMIMNDTEYVKKSIQNNSSYQFSTNYAKTNVFDLTRDSYTKISSSYNSSVDLVLEVSRWFKNYITGGAR